ncbi:MAG TPA: 3-deoxy-7-phosphoheptulonate synthase [Candidatus Baltobacteraceae bacterium]|nr:3-deoxy-7-phosphoheptulonate synthase [Candidatus Baltobacteraceae bacterium]
MYKLASRDRRAASVVRASDAAFGDGGFTMIAGPCAVESRAQIDRTAQFVALCGAQMLRAGAFKPRTSPYAFQGLGAQGVELIAQASGSAHLPCVVEALCEADLEVLAGRVSMIQIGARNMQNFALLRAAARTGLPILLKRAASATLDEVLYAAEYILVEGNSNVILCERGIRGFDPQTRNVFDLAGALRLKELTHLPVIADPSHATGRASLIEPVVLAAAAAGLDGAIVEVHPDPSQALSDKEQALDFPAFERLMRRLGALLDTEPNVPLAACR